MRILRQMFAPLRRFRRREDGTATIEFVIMFPLIFTFFLSSIEVGVFTMRSVMLDRALDLNVRALRLGALDPATHDELKRRICEDALVFADCPNAILIELTQISRNNWNMPTTGYTCVNRGASVQPAVEFNMGGENEIMLVRACAVLNPFFSTTPFVIGRPVDDTGGVTIWSASTFVNEP